MRPWVRAIGASLLLALGDAGGGNAGPCRTDCDVAARRCRADAALDGKQERAACAKAFQSAARCERTDDCLGFAEESECRHDARAFREARLHRCARLQTACDRCCASATSCSGGTLTVDDPDFLGTVGDEALSLTEGIRLATGTLDPAALSPLERMQVAGAPGAGRPDRVQLASGLVIGVRRRDEAVDAILPPLTDAGDAIEGHGGLVDGRPMAGLPQPATSDTFVASEGQFGVASMAPLLVIAASDVEVSGLRVEHVVAPNVIVLGTPEDGTSGVLLHDNTLVGIDRDVPVRGVIVTAGGQVSGRRLADVWVRRNRFLDLDEAITVSAGGVLATGNVRDNVAEDIHVVGNAIERPTEGIIACAATSALGGRIADNVLRHVDVAYNVVHEPLDVGLLIAGSCVVAGGTSFRNQVSKLRVRGNAVRSATGLGRQNTALFVAGAQVAFGDGGTAEADHIAGLAVVDNVVDGTTNGVLLAAAHVERCAGCRAAHVIVEHVAFRQNAWRNLDYGLVLQASTAAETAGMVQGNTLRRVRVVHDDVTARSTGVTLLGTNGFALPTGGPFFLSHMEFPGYRQVGTAIDNRVATVVLAHDRIEAQDGAAVLGGFVDATEDAVTNASVRDVRLETNHFFTTRSALSVIGGMVQTSGSVRGSRVVRVRGAGNVSAAGEAIGVYRADQAAVAGAPPESVRDNTVRHVAVH